MSGDPYRDTSVSAGQSKDQIVKTLRNAGARGVQVGEVYDADNLTEALEVRFHWLTEGGVVSPIRLTAKPLPPEAGGRGGWKVSPEQRERQAWRGLAWYLESLVKAATFGIVPFEAVFLAYFEAPDGRTIGDALIPEIEKGRLALPKASG